jgi:hypothetical protein
MHDTQALAASSWRQGLCLAQPQRVLSIDFYENNQSQLWFEPDRGGLSWSRNEST